MICSIRANHKLTEDPLQYHCNMHAHDQFEIMYFVHGDADFIAEGNRYHLKPGDVVVSCKSESHYLNVCPPAYYERIVVVFDLEDRGDNTVDAQWLELMAQKPFGKFNRFPAATFADQNWRYYLDRVCSCQEQDKKEVYLRLMMMELSEAYETVTENPQSSAPNRSTAIISYINQHLFEALSLDMLCQQFFLSKSQLNRIFKQATGSTVWNYILTKRLLRAKELLRSGENPVVVCEKCAFQNYVSFYKNYQKFFGCSPKEDHQPKK